VATLVALVWLVVSLLLYLGIAVLYAVTSQGVTAPAQRSVARRP
jgi:hypothetical protein